MSIGGIIQCLDGRQWSASFRQVFAGHVRPVLAPYTYTQQLLAQMTLRQDTDGMMNTRKYIAIVTTIVVVAACSWSGLRAYRNYVIRKRNSTALENRAAIANRNACEQRGAAYEKQIKGIEEDAHNQLKIGTKKADVSKFFTEHNIPFDFFEGEARGTLSTSGCAPVGCGTDSALIGVSVKLSQEGVVAEEPKVVALYIDCV